MLVYMASKKGWNFGLPSYGKKRLSFYYFIREVEVEIAMLTA